MTKEDLIRTAADIPAADPEAASEYAAKRDALVAEINQRLLARDDINELVGEGNLEMMKDNHANHGQFIESMLTHFEPATLVETVLWVFRAYRSRNFHPNYWASQLNAWVEVMKAHLSPQSYASILPLYQWMIVNIPQFTPLTDE